MNQKVPLVAAINDMSGFGRCSLTVAIPVISAMGAQVCPLPTAILSNHTAYDDCTFQDMTDGMDDYIEKWKKLGLSFDAIFTGFLGNLQQVEKILHFVDLFQEKKTLLLVDPVMADDGEIYSTYTKKMCEEMRLLVSRAAVVTPNLTEACILADEDYNDVMALCGQDGYFQKIEQIGQAINRAGAGTVVITGVKGPNKTICNVVTQQGEPGSFTVTTPMVERSYAGTGDVFASVLCGCMIAGDPVRVAVVKTAEFVRKVTQYTFELDSPWRDGIAFEPFLCTLSAKKEPIIP